MQRQRFTKNVSIDFATITFPRRKEKKEKKEGKVPLEEGVE